MKKDRIRFRQYVNVNEKNGCWEWIGYKTSAGYGRFYETANKKFIPAHHYPYRLRHKLEFIPPGMVIHHVCGNKTCCNPVHLEMVTQKRNMELAAEAFAFLGLRHWRSRLTEEQIREIWILFDPIDGFNAQTLAAKYGVSIGTIYNALKYRR